MFIRSLAVTIALIVPPAAPGAQITPRRLPSPVHPTRPSGRPLPRDQGAPGAIARVPIGDRSGLRTTFRPATGEIYRATVATGDATDLPLVPLPLEGFQGAQRVLRAYGRLMSRQSAKGPNLLVTVYAGEADALWLEISVGSEAIREPIPGMVGHLEIRLNGVSLFDADVACPDETGIALRVGQPFPIIQTDLVARLARRIPPMRITPATIEAWCSRIDPDPYWNTHQTGSPRNAFWPLDLIYYLRSGNARCLQHLSDFILSQYGFVGRDGTYRPGRPYHLSEDNGRPWRTGPHYRVDPDSARPAEMLEGRPLIFSAGADTLGRKTLWPKGIPRAPRNGYDHEHMEVERLFAGAILLRSERARRDLIHLGEGIWSQKWGIKHSSRTLGWCLRLYVRLYQVFGKPRDLARIDEILTWAWEDRDWKGRSPIPCLQTRESQKGGSPGDTWEATWQASTVGTAAYEAYLQFLAEDRPELAAKARRLLLHAAECCLVGWHPEKGGMADSYEIFTETRPDSRQPAKYYGAQMLGVGMWPTATLALAYEVSGEVRFARPARQLGLHATRARAWGHLVNSSRSWVLPFFLDADRILKIAVPQG